MKRTKIIGSTRKRERERETKSEREDKKVYFFVST